MKFKEFEKVIGYESIKTELERIADIITNPEKYKALGVNTPGGVLLFGNPGLGKTLMSKCFIEACRRPTFTVRKDTPDGDFVKKIKETFDEAVKASEKGSAIIFLDDMDKFANEDQYHCNAEEYVTIQSCIDENKGKDIFIIATANSISTLPNSLLRAGRFDKVIEVNSPKKHDTTEIIRFYLSKKKNVGDVDPEEVARILDGNSCAELETVINEAGIYAAFEGKDTIDMDDILKACMRIIYNAPLDEYETDDNPFVKNIAYHEAGHAVVDEIIEPDSVNLITVAKNDGEVGGFTSYNQNEYYFHTKEYMENRVMSLLAGKAATEIVYGTTDVGANSDLHRAFRIVGRFVDDYCSYGFNYWEGECMESSPDLLARKEQMIYAEMEKYYQKAKKILIENRGFLDKLADELAEKKILVAKDIKRIREAA